MPPAQDLAVDRADVRFTRAALWDIRARLSDDAYRDALEFVAACDQPQRR